MKIALSIAGSDCSGGAGIQADLKTMIMNGVYAMSVITALTAQNTKGVAAVEEVSPAFLKAQLDAVFTDIRPDAIKIGMLASNELIEVVTERIQFYQAKQIVLDPVMVATSGANLINADAIATLKSLLLPLADLLTPNIPEAENLSGEKIRTEAEMIRAGQIISETYQTAVLVKGGHNINNANDVLCYGGEVQWFKSERVNNPNTHGTGCTLSSAIAAYLAQGKSLSEAIKLGKCYLSGALRDGMNIGAGSGPLNHAYKLREKMA